MYMITFFIVNKTWKNQNSLQVLVILIELSRFHGRRYCKWPYLVFFSFFTRFFYSEIHVRNRWVFMVVLTTVYLRVINSTKIVILRRIVYCVVLFATIFSAIPPAIKNIYLPQVGGNGYLSNFFIGLTFNQNNTLVFSSRNSSPFGTHGFHQLLYTICVHCLDWSENNASLNFWNRTRNWVNFTRNAFFWGGAGCNLELVEKLDESLVASSPSSFWKS